MSETKSPAPPPPSAAPASTPQRKAYAASNWTIHAWGLGAVAGYFLYEQFYLIQGIHVTVFKVDPFWVGVILFFPRLVDGILDPILGHWSDNLHSSWGRRKPFILVAGVLGAVLASSIFWLSPDWTQLSKCVFLAATAITLFIATGTYDMAFTAMGYELSEDYADRSRIQAIRNVYWSAFSIAGGFVTGVASDPQGTGDFLLGGIQGGINGIEHAWHYVFGGAAWSRPLWDWWQSWRPSAFFYSEAGGFRWVSHVISVTMVVSLIFPLLWARERYTKLVTKKHVDLWQAMKATIQCRPFVVILITNIARNAGALPRSLLFYIGTYYVCFGSKAEYSNWMGGINAIVGLGFTIVVWWTIKPLTKYVGKRAAFIGGAAMQLVQAVGTWYVAVPGNIAGWFIFNLAFMPVGAIFGASAAGIMPDICDIDELAYGERREGLFTAVQSFVNKMEISVMMLFSGVLIKLTGFSADLGANQPKHVLELMRWIGFVPLIGIAAIAFITSCFMSITASQMEVVRAELDKRHEMAGLAAEAKS